MKKYKIKTWFVRTTLICSFISLCTTIVMATYKQKKVIIEVPRTKIITEIQEKEVYIEIPSMKLTELEIENEELKNRIKELEEEIEELSKLKKKLDNFTETDIINLCKIVTAEAGYNSASAQKNVAYVVLNRINSPKFPNTLSEVIFQQGQFSCVNNGMFDNAKVTNFTKNNVTSAILNYEKGTSAQGALYFCAGGVNGSNYLFTDDVGHNFSK